MNNFKAHQFYAKNQFFLHDENKDTLIFQSYNSTICKIDNTIINEGIITIYNNFDYSHTTSKYLHKFLDEMCCYGLYEFIKKNDIRKNKQLQFGKYKIVFEGE